MLKKFLNGISKYFYKKNHYYKKNYKKRAKKITKRLKKLQKRTKKITRKNHMLSNSEEHMTYSLRSCALQKFIVHNKMHKNVKDNIRKFVYPEKIFAI